MYKRSIFNISLIALAAVVIIGTPVSAAGTAAAFMAGGFNFVQTGYLKSATSNHQLVANQWNAAQFQPGCFISETYKMARARHFHAALKKTTPRTTAALDQEDLAMIEPSANGFFDATLTDSTGKVIKHRIDGNTAISAPSAFLAQEGTTMNQYAKMPFELFWALVNCPDAAPESDRHPGL